MRTPRRHADSPRLWALLHHTRSVALAALALGAAACSEPERPRDGGRDASRDGTGCPVYQQGVTGGTSCDEPGLVCTYGDQPQTYCRNRLECDRNNTWHDRGIGECTASPDAVCPSVMPRPDDPCMDNGLQCAFADGARCTCTNCNGPCTPQPRWVCAPPPVDPGCPRQMPNLGAPCPFERLDCNYGGCIGGWHMRCESGRWIQVQDPCPR